MPSIWETNPELLENSTLGAATTTPFLDQVEKQNKEDFNARQEGREPRTVVVTNIADRFPGAVSAGSVPSYVQPTLAFEEDEYRDAGSSTEEDVEIPTYTPLEFDNDGNVIEEDDDE